MAVVKRVQFFQSHGSFFLAPCPRSRFLFLDFLKFDLKFEVVFTVTQTFIYSFTLHTYTYVTHEDICDVFNGDTLLAVMAPAGTQLEVPVPEVVLDVTLKYLLTVDSNDLGVQR